LKGDLHLIVYTVLEQIRNDLGKAHHLFGTSSILGDNALYGGEGKEGEG